MRQLEIFRREAIISVPDDATHYIPDWDAEPILDLKIDGNTHHFWNMKHKVWQFWPHSVTFAIPLKDQVLIK